MKQPMRSEAEVEKLVNDNRKLVEYMVNRYLKRYYVGNMERDDLVAWGMLGLVNAARAFDTSRNTSFSTLACRAIERMIIRGVNREWRPEREQVTLSLDSLISGGKDDGGEDRFVDQVPADENVERTLLQTERQVALESALNTLEPEQQQLIRRHYLDGENVENIARDLGLTRQGVYSREKAIFRKLRERLEDDALALAA
ncbi:MAG: sigma-70 family RNA polymerase sigma factor [Armatimonadota bacterium]